MKKLLIVLLTLSSLSAFSFEDSEFERGYVAGKATCDAASEAWMCSFPKTYCMQSGSNFKATGRSRAEAILKIDQACIEYANSILQKPNCVKL